MSRNTFRINNSKYSSGMGSSSGMTNGSKNSADSGFSYEPIEKSTQKKSSNPFSSYSKEQLMQIIRTNQKTLESEIMTSQHVIEVNTTNNKVRYHV
jgi:hypothetical protein